MHYEMNLAGAAIDSYTLIIAIIMVQKVLNVRSATHSTQIRNIFTTPIDMIMKNSWTPENITFHDCRHVIPD